MSQRTLLMAGIGLMAAGILLGASDGLLLGLAQVGAGSHLVAGHNGGPAGEPGEKGEPGHHGMAPGFPGGPIPGRRHRGGWIPGGQIPGGQIPGGHIPGGQIPGLIPKPSPSPSPNA